MDMSAAMQSHIPLYLKQRFPSFMLIGVTDDSKFFVCGSDENMVHKVAITSVLEDLLEQRTNQELRRLE
jgi:hypothetical protein